MNQDFQAIESVLAGLRADYAAQCPQDVEDPAAPVTEADIAGDLRHRLRAFCKAGGYQVHCEIRPAANDAVGQKRDKSLPRIDVVVLTDRDGASWLSAAKKLQDQCGKGSIEARFASVPVRFFHTAIEAKIQSKVDDARKDIDGLHAIQERNPLCNCFFILLNARGRARDHEQIRAYAREKNVAVVDYAAENSG